MVIIYDAIFGCICTTVFQLTEWIGPISMKTRQAVSWCMDWLGFSVHAIPTRHCVPIVQHSRMRYIIDFNRLLLTLR